MEFLRKNKWGCIAERSGQSQFGPAEYLRRRLNKGLWSSYGNPGFRAGEGFGIGIEAVSIRCGCSLLTEARARDCVLFLHAGIPKITLQKMLGFFR